MKQLILTLILFTISLNAQSSELIMLFGDDCDGLNLQANAGDCNTGDWTDWDEDGKADSMTANGTPTLSIVVEGTNRFQKVLRLGSSNNFNGIILSYGVDGVIKPCKSGVEYQIIIGYRSNGAELRLGLNAANWDTWVGAAEEILTIEPVAPATDASIYLTFNNESDNTKYIEIDYVRLIVK